MRIANHRFSALFVMLMKRPCGFRMDQMPFYRLDGDGKSLDMSVVTQPKTGSLRHVRTSRLAVETRR